MWNWRYRVNQINDNSQSLVTWTHYTIVVNALAWYSTHSILVIIARLRAAARSHGDLNIIAVPVQTLICAPVVRPKRYPTSSNPALLRSWTVVCPSFTLLMMLLLPGWPTMGLNRIRKKKKSPTTRPRPRAGVLSPSVKLLACYALLVILLSLLKLFCCA